MSLDDRLLALLQALAHRDGQLRADGRSADFLLVQARGGRFALKPGVEGIAELNLQEGDILDLEEEGFVRTQGSAPANVRLKFSLTSLGRTAGRPLAVTADIRDAPPTEAPPSSDDVLAWIYVLSATGPGGAILETGGALVNEAIARFGPTHVERVARAIIDLRDEGYLAFDDPAAHIDQFADSERLSHGRDFRVMSAGRDRVQPGQSASLQAITQIIYATNAQVAARDINNYVSFNQLLDDVGAELEALEGIDEEARVEAKSILSKLRSATGTIATGSAASAGGALLGGLIRQLLGLS